MRSSDIRQSFIDFFVDRGHQLHPSAPLVPHGDATLLFTNAGMVQFKDYFLGLQRPPRPRAVTSQKCLRVSGKHNDLENVGPSPRHHTFFEMLGNFSFGDYFKEEAIEFAWQLVTEGWGLNPDHLFATVFEEDDEARDLWLRLSSLPESRVIRCGEKDNFWAMGDTGPCGPCSEIFVDCAPEATQVDFESGSDAGRYMEIWNLVFMQYERSADGRITPLPKPSIDTGSGLERVSAALQGVTSSYDTDLFAPLLVEAARVSGHRYGTAAEDDVSLRVIADHLRAVAFLLADGVIPSNEGRGYVLRRILRRAVRHGMRLGLEEPFLAGLLPVMVEMMGSVYPELTATAAASGSTIGAEEEKFRSTVANGARQLQDAIVQARERGEAELSGDAAFRLYDTYGLPLETVQEIVEEEQFAIDTAGFERELERQRARSRSAGSASGGVQEAREVLLGVQPGGRAEDAGSSATAFLGYRQLEAAEVPTLRLARVSESGLDQTSALGTGEKGVAIFENTVFYAESGGQVADLGELEWPDGRAEVTDVQRDTSGVVFHWLEVISGELECGALVTQRVEAARRRQTQRHHTATHLLHAALRQHLGEGVRQAGSLVHPDRLRFDYTYGTPLSEDQRRQVEDSVRDWVRRSVAVEIGHSSYEDAIREGATALFGEKYPDEVRTVHVPGFSLELCGGCHVGNTGEIGSFVIMGERASASGVRRIEALAGRPADAHARRQNELLQEVEKALGAPADRLEREALSLKARLKETEKQLAQMRVRLLSAEASAGEGGDDQSGGEISIDGVKLLVREVPAAPAGELRNLADVMRQRIGSGVVLLGARSGGKVSVVAAVTQDLKDQVHAGRLARKVGDALGGSGGGRADFAQAGGKDSGTLTPAFNAAKDSLTEQLATSS